MNGKVAEWLRIITPVGIFLLGLMLAQQNARLGRIEMQLDHINDKVDQHIQYHLSTHLTKETP